RKDVARHVTELLGWVGLKDHMRARPPTLSGGQQQRVAIARAVISRPSLLLADEPTGNVDDQMGYRLIHLFEELNRLGTTVIIATHSQQLVERLGYAQMKLAAGGLTVIPGRHQPEPQPEPVAAPLPSPPNAPIRTADSRPPAAAEDERYRDRPGVENYL
ncbi:MAG: ATP-binding cassette domain-containing protein, partial [Rhodospirillaceae bacterium]